MLHHPQLYPLSPAIPLLFAAECFLYTLPAVVVSMVLICGRVVYDSCSFPCSILNCQRTHCPCWQLSLHLSFVEKQLLLDRGLITVLPVYRLLKNENEAGFLFHYNSLVSFFYYPDQPVYYSSPVLSQLLPAV